MATKPVTPNLKVPPDMVRFPAAVVPDTPVVTLAIDQITVSTTIALDGADLLFTSSTLDIASDVSISGGANVSFGNLTSLTGSASLNVTGSAVESVDFGNLATLDGSSLNIVSTSITSVALTDLATISSGGDLLVRLNALLTSLTLPSLTSMNDGFELRFDGNALPSANVNAILTLVLDVVTDQSLTAGTLALQGGTNGAPTGQGITDKAALILAGITVTTN